MPLTVLHCLRPRSLAGFLTGRRAGFRAVTLGFAVLLAGAGTGFAQGASYTAAGSDGAVPVLLGNNALPQAPSPIASSGPIAVQPITIVTPTATSSEGTNKFKMLMDQVNSNMTINANAAAAEREKKLAAETEARNAAYGREMRGGQADPNNRDGHGSSASGDTIIMHYAEPNDRGAAPAHTFHID